VKVSFLAGESEFFEPYRDHGRLSDINATSDIMILVFQVMLVDRMIMRH